MKFIILFCVALIVCIQARKYDSFVDPLSDEFIDLVNEKATTWKAGRNFPKETPMKYLKRLMGTNPRSKNVRRSTLVYDIPDNFTFPDNFDAREAWPQCPIIGEIMDQGDCGSCWAISATDVMSNRICILSNGEDNFRFSAEDVLSCIRNGDSCDGGHPDEAFGYMQTFGAVSGGPYNSSKGCSPYQKQPCEHHSYDGNRPNCVGLDGETPVCQKTCQTEYDIAYEDDLHFATDLHDIFSVKDAKYELITSGPIAATMDVYQDFFTYKSGIYSHTTGIFVGNHGVRILGYGVEGGVKYWLCANSWNTDWGEGGFFKILRGKNEVHIEYSLTTGMPKL